MVTLPFGTTTITLVVNDGSEDSAPDTVDITVVDTTAPVVTLLTTSIEVPPTTATAAMDDVLTESGAAAVDGPMTTPSSVTTARLSFQRALRRM